MSVSSRSVVKTSISSSRSFFSSSSAKSKNKHLFGERYADLCQSCHTLPLNYVKQYIDQNMIDFVGDRIKYEEWGPILSALSTDQSLHIVGIRSRHPMKIPLDHIDTESKMRNIPHPCIVTGFLLEKLMTSLQQCLSNSRALTVLELEGLALSPRYMTLLCEGIGANATLQHLSFYKSYIHDAGVEILCSVVKHIPSLVSLDLSLCGLSQLGAESIAGLIKYQKLSRFDENWKQTLRYRDPDVEAMPGLRRITLNGNDIKDEGIVQLAAEMEDDLWVRAVDLQDCSLTDQGARLLVQLIRINRRLEVVDIRGNSGVSQASLTEIMAQLNFNHGDKPTEYKWISRKMNPQLKQFMITARHSPSVISLTRRPSLSARSVKGSPSQLTLVESPLSSLRKEKSNIDLKLKREENNKIREQYFEIQTILNEEMKWKKQLLEENEELKKKLAESKEEVERLLKVEDVYHTAQSQTLIVLETIISRFGSFLTLNQEKEVGEIVSSLKSLLHQGETKPETCQIHSKNCSNISLSHKRSSSESSGSISEEDNQVIVSHRSRKSTIETPLVNRCVSDNSLNKAQIVFANMLQSRIPSKALVEDSDEDGGDDNAGYRRNGRSSTFVK